MGIETNDLTPEQQRQRAAENIDAKLEEARANMGKLAMGPNFVVEQKEDLVHAAHEGTNPPPDRQTQ